MLFLFVVVCYCSYWYVMVIVVDIVGLIDALLLL